ncbi:hypothetical protein [Roseovarius sp. SYSU LYC5161]|uniref:hypothetical protein n=1 Tax=Roseovarius halophilus (ex Wu et al. 2025) TaxID=3376060 RepID=UPI0039999CC5
MPEARSRTAEIRALARHDLPRAEAALTALLAELFGIPVQGLAIRRDAHALNSLFGDFESDGAPFFFKFHQEEGEEEMAGEYYRADILARAGLPVDQPVHISRVPGEQILVYHRRDDARFADVLRDLERSPDEAGISRAVTAEAELNDRLLGVARDTLHPITPAQSRAQPIHRLFHARLVDPASGSYPGGRLAQFYEGKTFALPGCEVSWAELATARPVLNGVAHARSLGEMFDFAHARLAPERLADAGGITAHGDAHNANVWYERHDAGDRLALFDPAFAGQDVPALLAEVKSTFHNVFAHPQWLYHPVEAAARFRASARLEDGRLYLDTDWTPGAPRLRLLEAKADRFWRPWLVHLKGRGYLPPDWEDVIRAALFLSPTLVMNLRAGGGGGHDPVSSAIGLFVALRVGSAPVDDSGDIVTDFFRRVRPD